MPSLSEICDLSIITPCLVLPGFLMDTLLNLEVHAYLGISLKRLFDLFLEIKKKRFSPQLIQFCYSRLYMKLNKYLFNTVNNKELGRGQRSVVWLKRGQPCLHQLHVLSTVFSWRPFSSFSLWIILLPPSLPPPPPPPPPPPLYSSTVKSV